MKEVCGREIWYFDSLLLSLLMPLLQQGRKKLEMDEERAQTQREGCNNAQENLVDGKAETGKA